MLITFENTYTSTFICRLYPVKVAHPKGKHRKGYKEEKRGRSVFGKNRFSSYVFSRFGNHYALFIG